MLIIADNLNVRNKAYMDAIKKKDKKALEAMAKELEQKGAEVINIQCSTDGSGDEESLPMVVEALQKGAAIPLSLDSRNIKALRRAVPLCKEPPIINYVSADEQNADEFFVLARESRSNVVLRALKGTTPSTLEAKLMVLEDLIEKANAADVPNERLLADPSIVHIARGSGQEHIVNAHESIIVLNEMVDPPINSVVWVANATSGLPKKIKSRVASSLLTYLAGAGLNAAFVDVMDEELMKGVYLIKAFRDDVIFSPADLA